MIAFFGDFGQFVPVLFQKQKKNLHKVFIVFGNKCGRVAKIAAALVLIFDHRDGRLRKWI
jgi:hypothetical protein